MALLQYRCDFCNLEFEELVKDSTQEVKCKNCGNVAKRIYFGQMFSSTGKTVKKCSGNCKTCSGCK